MYLNLFLVIATLCKFCQAVELIPIAEAVTQWEAAVVEKNLMQEKKQHHESKRYALMMIRVTANHFHQELAHFCNKSEKYKDNPSAFVLKVVNLEKDFHKSIGASDLKGRRLFCDKQCFCGVPVFIKSEAFLMLLEVVRKVQKEVDALEDNASTLLDDLNEARDKLRELETNFQSYLDEVFLKENNAQHDAFLEAKKFLWHSICSLPDAVMQEAYRRKYFSVI